MKKLVILVVVLALLASFAFAEGGQEKAGKPNVTFFWALYDGLTEEYRQNLENAFMDEYPGIGLDIVPIAWDQMNDKITTSLAGGDPPELSVIGTRWLLEFMSMDAVDPVDMYVSDSTLNNIFDGAKEAMIGGELMGLPVVAGARILTINNDLTDVVPETMEEMREAAIELEQDNPDAYGIIMPGKKDTEATDFAYYFYSAGGDFFETKSDGSYGECTIDSPAGVKALEFMKQLALEDEVVQKGFLSQARMDSHPVFYSGKAGYVMIGAWVKSAMEQAGADFPVTYAQIPPFEGHDPAPLIITDSIAFFSDAPALEEAGTFIDFFYQDEWKAKFDALVGFPPITKSAAKLPQFKNPLYDTLNAAAEVAKPWPLIEGWAEFSDIIEDMTSEVLLERKTPEKAAQDAADKIDSLRGM
jgi:multiple sugar transport system substrate-binding protein